MQVRRRSVFNYSVCHCDTMSLCQCQWSVAAVAAVAASFHLIPASQRLLLHQRAEARASRRRKVDTVS